MKVWGLRAPEPIESYPLELNDIPTLVPENDEILVRVSACGICRANLHVVEGEAPRLYATHARKLAMPAEHREILRDAWTGRPDRDHACANFPRESAQKPATSHVIGRPYYESPLKFLATKGHTHCS